MNSTSSRPVALAASIPSMCSAPVLNRVMRPRRSVPTNAIVRAERRRWSTIPAFSRAAVTSVAEIT